MIEKGFFQRVNELHNDPTKIELLPILDMLQSIAFKKNSLPHFFCIENCSYSAKEVETALKALYPNRRYCCNLKNTVMYCSYS